MKILITGAAGYLGQTTSHILKNLPVITGIYGVDIKNISPEQLNQQGIDNYKYYQSDIRSSEIHDIASSNEIDVICHLASILNPPPGMSADEVESIEIDGLKNILDAAKKSGSVKKIIFTSSGAAYGYYAENPPLITEDHRIKGNPEFPYSHHKAHAEKILNEFKAKNPEIKILILRPGTILGPGMKGPITDYFEKSLLIGIKGYDSPFCFILNKDVAQFIAQGCSNLDIEGSYNLSGDGSIPLKELASQMGTTYLSLPRSFMINAIRVLKKLRLTQYSPYQVDFMCYRPVLDNAKAKKVFNNLPSKTTQEVFDIYLSTRNTK